MDIKVVNKEIIFAKYKIIARLTFGTGENQRIITKEHIAFTDEQKNEYVNKYQSPWVVEVEDITWSSKLRAKAEEFKGLITTKEEAIKALKPFVCENLNEVKALKTQDLREICNATILSGFTSNTSGEELLYGYDMEDQSNWGAYFNVVTACKNGDATTIALLQAQGLPPNCINVKAKGISAWQIITFDQFMQLYLDSLVHLNSNRTKLYGLINDIANAQTIEEIEAIVW